jgi:pimeloyl-ACP methyl ester carboxylesterase
LYGDKKQAPIHITTYNPKGTATRPPEPVIFIHGVAGDHNIFNTIIRELNYPYGVISMNLYGRGSENPIEGEESGLDRHVADLIRVLNTLGYQRAFIVGHDLGGIVANKAITQYPHRINGVVLIDSGFSSEQGEQVEEKLNKEIESFYKNTDWSERLGFDTSKLNENDFKTYQNVAQKDLRSVMEQDIKSIKQENEGFDQLRLKRNPIVVIRPECSGALLDANTHKEMQNRLATKKSLVIKGVKSRYEIMFEPKYAKQIAQEIDWLLSQYDVHRKIQKMYEEVRNAPPDDRDNIKTN